MASMWQHGWRRWPSRVASWFRAVVHDQVRDKLSFGFEDMGEQSVKNIARPIGVHRVSLAESSAAAAVKSTAAAKPRLTSPTALRSRCCRLSI